MKKTTFSNVLHHISNGHSVDILSDNDTKSHEDCIAAQGKKTVDEEDNVKGRRILCTCEMTKATMSKLEGASAKGPSILTQETKGHLSGATEKVLCTHKGGQE